MSADEATRKKVNGAGSIRKRKEGQWEARFTAGFDPLTGKQIQKSIYGKTQAEVKKKLFSAIVDVDQGKYVANSVRMTFSKWLDIWIKTYCIDKKPNTIEQYKYQIRVNIKPVLGKYEISELSTEVIQRFYSALLLPRTVPGKTGKVKHPGLSAKSVKNVHGVVHEALEKAVKLRYISFNPSDNCELPRVQKTKITPFPTEMLNAFIKAIQKDELCDLYLVDLFTGMRQGEIMGLTWDSIDFNREQIIVRYQLQKERKQHGKYQLVSLKNDKERIIKPAPFVMDILRKIKKQQSRQQKDCGVYWKNQMNLVFTDSKGNHRCKSTVYNRLKRICKSIGIPYTRFHDLRHTYATISLENGDNIKTVSENLGHATVAFTLDIYGHVSDVMRRESAAKMQTFYENLNGKKNVGKGTGKGTGVKRKRCTR